MIGDWVLYNETPQQILEISGIDDEVYLETDELVHQSEIQPIPLTPKILEKSGFKKCAGNEWSVFKYEDDDYTKKALYQVLWSAKELYLEIASYTSKTGEFNRFGIGFVHQLQHALRLCRIDKTIEL